MTASFQIIIAQKCSSIASNTQVCLHTLVIAEADERLVVLFTEIVTLYVEDPCDFGVKTRRSALERCWNFPVNLQDECSKT